jgi:type II secretion system protein I
VNILGRRARAFTLLEVMVAIAILGIALLGLLGLQHQSMQSVVRAQQTTRASMLAQAVMTEAELERFPDLGITSGDFESAFPGEFRDFRWARNVEASGMFPDVRKVEVMIRYGPNLSQNFGIVEFLHSPVPPDTTTLPAGSTPAGSTPVGQTPVGQTP